jgi:hypothetical protein
MCDIIISYYWDQPKYVQSTQSDIVLDNTNFSIRFKNINYVWHILQFS